MSYNLLEFSRGGGCGCKIDPIKLHAILEDHKTTDAQSLLVDFLDKDDAAIIEINKDTCLIQTVDFFLPLVNNAYDFGRIAAANAISDVYAMGGKPILALSMLGWPQDILPLELAKEVLRGAESICKEAGISISGGHSIETKEPLFGLSVSGVVEKQNIKRKNTCQLGDYLYLTKPLGLGLLSNAIKHNLLSEDGYQILIETACQLNTVGIELGKNAAVNAMTDVTGFGLLGHLTEMLGGKFGAELELESIPVIPEAKTLAEKMVYPNITTSNYNYVKDHCNGLNGLEFLWLCDPQTSGGLLVSSSEVLNFEALFPIGRVVAGNRINIH
jgi:selenide,water dikinase